MREGTFEDVAEDFHFAVGMGGESHSRGDHVVIDDAQTMEAHVGRVEIICETEGMEASQPAVVGVSAFS